MTRSRLLFVTVMIGLAVILLPILLIGLAAVEFFYFDSNYFGSLCERLGLVRVLERLYVHFGGE
jgi:hypothetical protein